MAMLNLGLILRILALGLVMVVSIFLGVVWYEGSSSGAKPARPPRSAAPPAVAAEADPAPLPPVLNDEERKYLWDVEHHGNLLTRHGFSALTKALQANDAAALAALLAPDFHGHTLREPNAVRCDADYAQVVRQEDSGKPPLPLTAAQFVAQLLKYRQMFAQPPKAKLALMALSPTVRSDFSSPWEGTGQLRLWGETSPGQPGEALIYLKYQVDQPSEEGLHKGGWLRFAALTQVQESRASHFLMREVAAARGIEVAKFHDNWGAGGWPSPITGGVYLTDYNRDGYVDVLITDINGYALYQGLPDGKFRNVTAEVGLPELPDFGDHSAVAAFIDIDGDGWDDLILGDHVYRNDGGKRFLDYSNRSNLSRILAPDMGGLVVADYDRDGRLDLYVTRSGKAKTNSWLDGKSGDPRGNQLLRNLGNWQFADVTAAAGAGGGNRSTFSAVWFDANNDGWPDLFVINEFGNGVLLLNKGDGTFQEHHLTQGPGGDFGSMGVTVGDIDNDGNMDLYIGNMYSKAGNRVFGNVAPGTYPHEVWTKIRSLVAGSQLWRNSGSAAGDSLKLPAFEPMAKPWKLADVGWAYGPILVDLDNDGWLDLYANCGFISQSRTEPDG
jgi:hypothetical protein